MATVVNGGGGGGGAGGAQGRLLALIARLKREGIRRSYTTRKDPLEVVEGEYGAIVTGVVGLPANAVLLEYAPAKKVGKALGLKVGIVGLGAHLGAAGVLKRNPAFAAVPGNRMTVLNALAPEHIDKDTIEHLYAMPGAVTGPNYEKKLFTLLQACAAVSVSRITRCGNQLLVRFDVFGTRSTVEFTPTPTQTSLWTKTP